LTEEQVEVINFNRRQKDYEIAYKVPADFKGVIIGNVPFDKNGNIVNDLAISPKDKTIAEYLEIFSNYRTKVAFENTYNHSAESEKLLKEFDEIIVAYRKLL